MANLQEFHFSSRSLVKIRLFVDSFALVMQRNILIVSQIQECSQICLEIFAIIQGRK